MSSRVETEGASGVYTGETGASAPLAAIAFDPDADLGHHLPADHPAWMRDALSLSARARALLAKVPPVVIRVLTFWDHTVRAIVVDGRRLAVDPSGCYRFER